MDQTDSHTDFLCESDPNTCVMTTNKTVITQCHSHFQQTCHHTDMVPATYLAMCIVKELAKDPAGTRYRPNKGPSQRPSQGAANQGASHRPKGERSEVLQLGQ